VAERLHGLGLGTLLFDLLDRVEAADRSTVFDIPLLGERLADVVAWLAQRSPAARIGLFGASTGAGAALWAAGGGADVGAVVSRGGRPDLAGARLESVTAPTLLVVGGADTTVLALNRRAQAQMTGACRLEVVPGAGHLFEEPGTLEAVADLAGRWFLAHLVEPRSGSPEHP
jgi:pimeloyl-ACP methyl ester carboxylesterase